MTTIQAFFPKIGTLFPNFWKSEGEIPPTLTSIIYPYPNTQNLNTKVYNCIQDIPVLTSIMFCFCYNALIRGFKYLSMSESLAISLVLE